MMRRPRVRAAVGRRRDTALSLDLDSGAGFLELLLDVLRFFLGDPFLDRARHALDEILRFLQAQARHGTDDLDDPDLVLAKGSHDNGKLRLFLGRSLSPAAAGP